MREFVYVMIVLSSTEREPITHRFSTYTACRVAASMNVAALQRRGSQRSQIYATCTKTPRDYGDELEAMKNQIKP